MTRTRMAGAFSPHQKGRPAPWHREPLRLALAALAAGLALTPWLGRFSAKADILASLFPLAFPLGLFALLAPPWRRPGRLRTMLAFLAMGLPAAAIWQEERGEAARSPAAGSEGPIVTLVTHNLWVANEDPEGTMAALLASGADILVLQEANGRMVPSLGRLDAAYPHGNRCRPGCDVVIRSKWPLSRVRWRFRDAEGHPVGPPLMQTVATLPGGARVPIVGLHLPRPTTPGQLQAQRIAELASTLAKTDRRRMILAGDFNLTPWASAMGTTAKALAPLRRVTRARFSYPARFEGHVWPWPLLPIDHVWAGPEWETLSVERLPATGSDHYPLRIRFRLRNP